MRSGGGFNRRSFLIAASAVGGGLALGFAVPLRARADGRLGPGRGRSRNHLLADHRARRHGHDPCRPFRNGAGRDDRTRHAGRRRTRMRLVQGAPAIDLADREYAARQCLGRHLDRRQPLDRVLAALFAAGRRHRARHADHGRGGALECAGGAMRGEQQHHHAHTDRTHFELWRRRRGRRRCRAVDRYQAERAGPVEARRHAAEAARYPRQGHGHPDLWHRCAAARHALCRARALSGVQGHAEIRRRELDRRHEGRAPCGAHGRRGRGDRGFLVARQMRGRSAESDMGRSRQWRFVERGHRRTGARRPRYAVGAGRPQARRCGDGARRRRQASAGRLRRAVSGARDHGAAELHRACEAGQCRGLGADARIRRPRSRPRRLPPASPTTR